jgi:hypothetical protein
MKRVLGAWTSDAVWSFFKNGRFEINIPFDTYKVLAIDKVFICNEYKEIRICGRLRNSPFETKVFPTPPALEKPLQ